ncbi:MAG: extracellular solute-binding protein [Burkholderiales bacterium]|nr:extracellular solute-binding protein [Burkholderiales bacterium]
MQITKRGSALLRTGAGALLAASALTAAQAQQTLTVAAYPAVDAIVKSAIPAFKAKHPNVDIQVVSRQFADHHTAMTTALATSSHLPDVMVLEVGYVGRFAQGGGLEDLTGPAYGVQKFKSRFVPYAYDQATSRGGAVVAVPSDIGPGTLLYRADILAKAGVDPAQMTKSWDSFVAAGVTIKAKTGAYLMANARNIKDIVIRTGIEPGAGIYFDAKGKPDVTSPRFLRAFELARRVRQQGLDGKINDWSNEWGEGFKRGTLASEMTGAWLAGHLSTWLAPNTKGLWRAAQLPEGSWAAYGGSFYAIPKAANPANKAMAWELIKMMTLDRSVQINAFKTQDAFPALLETYDDPFFDQPIEFLGGQKARLIWREAARHIKAVTVNELDPFAEEVVNTELDKVLDQGKDPAAALADAQRLLEHRVRR